MLSSPIPAFCANFACLPPLTPVACLQDLPLGIEPGQQRLQELIDMGWIDEYTRALQVSEQSERWSSALREACVSPDAAFVLTLRALALR